MMPRPMTPTVPFAVIVALAPAWNRHCSRPVPPRTTPLGTVPRAFFPLAAATIVGCGARNRPLRARLAMTTGAHRMNVGVAGLGKMGAAIALRLIDVGHSVTVWNRSSDKCKPLAVAGATVAGSPAAVAAASEAIITNAAAMDAVYAGPEGLLATDVSDKLFIEMSTVQPATELTLADKVRRKGAAFVECPVGGSTGPARQGQLIGLLGGAPADADRAEPLMRPPCPRIEHFRPVRGGAPVKLPINMPLLVSGQG